MKNQLHTSKSSHMLQKQPEYPQCSLPRATIANKNPEILLGTIVDWLIFNHRTPGQIAHNRRHTLFEML